MPKTEYFKLALFMIPFLALLLAWLAFRSFDQRPDHLFIEKPTQTILVPESSSNFSYEHELTFINRSRNEFKIIGGAAVDCDCVEILQLPLTIPANSKRSLTIRFDDAKVNQHRTVRFFSNPESSRIIFSIAFLADGSSDPLGLSSVLEYEDE